MHSRRVHDRTSKSARRPCAGLSFGLALLAINACSSSSGGTTSSAGGASGGSAGSTGAHGGASATSGGTNNGGTTNNGGGGKSGAGGATAGTGGSNGGAGNNAGAGNMARAGGGSASNTAGAGGATAGAGNTAGAGGAAASYDPCPTDGTACKVMPFGDSITDGYGVPGGYRIPLFASAHEAGKNIAFVGSQQNGPTMVDNVAFPQHHEGHSGYTIDPTPSRSGISPLVASVMPTYTPHIITLMIGTNDAIDDYDMVNAPTRLGNLIDSIITQLPQALIVVAQIIPSQDDALNGRIQTYNAAIPAVVQTRATGGKHLVLVNMYPVIASNPNFKTALLNDTWHPNSDGYALMAGVWYGVLGPLFH